MLKVQNSKRQSAAEQIMALHYKILTEPIEVWSHTSTTSRCERLWSMCQQASRQLLELQIGLP